MVTESRREDLTIGRISALSGVKIETIRYYERIGLLAQPSRTSGGRRLYGAEDVRALGFIRRSRELGFSIDDIRSLQRLARSKATCREFRDIAEARLEEVRARLLDLGKTERVLDLAIARCTGDDVPECAILDVLDAGRVA